MYPHDLMRGRWFTTRRLNNHWLKCTALQASRLGQQGWAKWLRPPKHRPQMETLVIDCGYKKKISPSSSSGWMVILSIFIPWWVHFKYFNYFQDTPDPPSSRLSHSVQKEHKCQPLRQTIQLWAVCHLYSQQLNRCYTSQMGRGYPVRKRK